jgi:uncharacterized protein
VLQKLVQVTSCPAITRGKKADLTLNQAILLFIAGVLGGAINGVAGGGSFFSFPALLFTGVAPVAANTTSTLALWFGIVASGGAYRKQINLPRRVMIPLLVTSVVGGLIGSLLLIHTPAHTFVLLIPWLLLAATLLFAFGKYLTRYMAGGLSGHASPAAVGGASVFELLVSTYGGYFGGGMGIMNLAMLAALGLTDINVMNGLKAVLGATTNGVAAVTFIFTKSILWPQAIVMTGGAVVGGFLTAHYAQRLPQELVRTVVIVVGTGMTAYFFYRYYH